jgi:tryptophan 2,3-dioxygenase
MTPERLAEIENGDDYSRIKTIRDLCAALREVCREKDKYKWEYDNLCKFATDFENQREHYRDRHAKLRKLISQWWVSTGNPTMRDALQADDEAGKEMGK